MSVEANTSEAKLNGTERACGKAGKNVTQYEKFISIIVQKKTLHKQ